MIRIPVKFCGKCLMPMKGSKAARLIKEGRAKIKFDRKTKNHYLVLLFQPTGSITQGITVAIDPGSTFDGFSVVSKKNHHLNAELIQRPKIGKESIKSFKERQAMNRRTRRLRKWHRVIRFAARTRSKLAPTIRANVEFRIWYLTKLMALFPLTKCVIEDVRYNHSKDKKVEKKKGKKEKKSKGAAFSHEELGKSTLYNFVEESGMQLELVDGWLTKQLRVNSFGADPKIKDKGSKTFNAHCIDSFVLACDKAVLTDAEGNIKFGGPVIVNDLVLNKKVTFIEKIVKVRRCLTRTRKKYKESKFYYKLKPGGFRENYKNMTPTRTTRAKPEEVHSNHPKKWIKKKQEPVERFKSNTARYGGTTYNGKSFFKNNEWQNRIIS